MPRKSSRRTKQSQQHAENSSSCSPRASSPLNIFFQNQNVLPEIPGSPIASGGGHAGSLAGKPAQKVSRGAGQPGNQSSCLPAKSPRSTELAGCSSRAAPCPRSPRAGGVVCAGSRTWWPSMLGAAKSGR